MLYIVRVHEDGQVYEYEYGLPEHAREHMRQEHCHAELFLYNEGREWFMEAVN